MAKFGSAFCASTNASRASSYSKECINSTPLMKCGCAAGDPDVGKSIVPSSCDVAGGPRHTANRATRTARCFIREMISAFAPLGYRRSFGEDGPLGQKENGPGRMPRPPSRPQALKPLGSEEV